MTLTQEEIAARMDALRRARVDSQIEGLQTHPDEAAILDAWVRGEIDGDEARQRGLAFVLRRSAQRKRAA